MSLRRLVRPGHNAKRGVSVQTTSQFYARTSTHLAATDIPFPPGLLWPTATGRFFLSAPAEGTQA